MRNIDEVLRRRRNVGESGRERERERERGMNEWEDFSLACAKTWKWELGSG